MTALIVGMVGLWAIGGFMAGLALETIGFDGYRLSITCAGVNVLIGLALFKIVMDDDTLDDIFFGRVNVPARHAGRAIIRGLWLLPLMLLFIGTLMWTWAVILNILVQE